LAAFVQLCNDLLAGPDDYLSPENSLLALELGWLTVGTADADDTVIHAWVAELLASPVWGVVRYAKRAARYAKSAVDKAVLDIAELHRAAAAGDMPPIADWKAADRAARTACRATKPTVHIAGLYALRAAYQSTALVETDRQATLDAVTTNALQAHAQASVDAIARVPLPWRRARTGDTKATPIVGVTQHAIHAWRRLAGLDNSGDIDSTPVPNVVQLIGIPA
jgi:hypothetical protein